jgi:uncharacterized damage-inducible protein DinB
MLRDHLIDGHRYSAWGNRRYADALSAADPIPEDVLRLFSHVARAEAIWIGRVLGSEEAQLEVWHTDALADARARSERAAVAWTEHLASCGDDALLAPVQYQNSRGTPFSTPLNEISAHVVSHGAYHRGQIAALLRAAGHAPPSTDRIVYARLAPDER